MRKGCDFIGEVVEIPYIILLTHGRWGEELIKGAEMIVGELEEVYAFSLMPETPLDEYVYSIEKVLKVAPEGTLILADMYGSTTSNVSAFLSTRYEVNAISGLSLIMLISADEIRKNSAGKEIVRKILSTTTEGCKDIISAINNY